MTQQSNVAYMNTPKDIDPISDDSCPDCFHLKEECVCEELSDFHRAIVPVSQWEKDALADMDRVAIQSRSSRGGEKSPVQILNDTFGDIMRHFK